MTIASSHFINWLIKSEGRMPRQEWIAIHKAGRDRLVTRLRAGYADSVLDFSDLVARGEEAIAPATKRVRARR